MLLPSALSCDSRRPSRFTPMRLFSTPPPSDDDSGLPGNGLLGTCRALQSLLNVSPAPSSRRAKPARLQSPLHIVPTPPSPASSRKHKRSLTPRKSPAPKPSRGVNKRRRNTFEEDTHTPIDLGDNTTLDADANPSTPKRRRHLPYDLPLGLSQTDFYSLYSPPVTQSPPSPAQRRQQECHTPPPFNPDAALPSIEEPTSPASNQDQDQGWTSDDDQRLVELVLEKFRLSKQDWDDCARRMGKDHASVGQRWQALVGEGNVGLRRGRRRVRSRIHKDWM